MKCLILKGMHHCASTQLLSNDAEDLQPNSATLNFSKLNKYDNPQNCNLIGYFTTSTRVWHSAHHSTSQELQKYIQRSNQECPRTDETPKFGPSVC